MPKPIHIISLGAGVQSSTIALRAAFNLITPMPIAAIFADTGDEPKNVYEYLAWLKTKLPFPVIEVRMKDGPLSRASLLPRVSKDGKKYIRLNLPVFTKTEQSGYWTQGKTNRKCTSDAKIEPILKAMRQMNLENGNNGVVQWIGISVDEISRAKESRHAWLTHRHPLLEQRMNRNDCIQWIKANNFPIPPRSACVYCPFHSDSEWRRLKTELPEEFEKAVLFDVNMRTASLKDDILKSEPFLHRSCKPLSEVDFSTEEERGQLNMFNNECEGMCGV